MPTYFKPLRRKIGAVTLVTACALVGVWLRSLTIEDMVDHWSSFTGQAWSSSRGVFHWSTHEHGRVIPRALRGRYNWQSLPLDRMTDPQNFQRHVAWQWRYLGISYWNQSEPIKASEFEIRYSSIVIPLTLLSAWLLLSRPRVKKIESIDLATKTEP